MKQWRNISDAAQRLGITERALRYRINKGTIESKMEGDRRLVLVEWEEMEGKETENVTETEGNFRVKAETAIQRLLDSRDAHIKTLETQIESLMREIRDLRVEAQATAEREADARQRSDTIIMQLSKTIEKQQSEIQEKSLLIEDLREPKSFWKQLFHRRKLAESAS